MSRYISLVLNVALVGILFAVNGTARAQKDSSAPKSAVLQTSGTLTGTVVTGIVTPGGDCPHRYWLKVSPAPKGTENSLIALEPESKTLARYVNKKVKLEGMPKMCHGVEIDMLVFVIEHISPGD